MTDRTLARRPTDRLWPPRIALAIVLMLAWSNLLTTARWAAQPGALHGWRKPWYTIALIAASILTIVSWRRIGGPGRVGRSVSIALLVSGGAVLVNSLLSRLPPSTWLQIPFKDDWTPLFQHAVSGVELMRRGVVVGWNWWFLGGYPTSTDIAQNLAALAFIPMTLFGDRLGYHLLHVVLFLVVPLYVWCDLGDEDRETRRVATGLACCFAAGFSGAIGSSGTQTRWPECVVQDWHWSAAVPPGEGGVGAARYLMLGLTLALYSHAAFFIYALIYLCLEALYFRDRAAALRLAMAAALSLVAALPLHWESLRYPTYVSFNNTVYDPGAPVNWPLVARTIYYNVEILAFPHRWFNDYRSVANIWLPAILVVAFDKGRSRTGFFACAVVLTQALLRFNTSEVGAVLDRIQHMLPMLTAPALASFLLRFAGTRRLAIALIAVLALYVQTALVPVRHVPELRAFYPEVMDRIASSDGNMVLVEISPHRDMDSHPTRRSPTTPFDVHFEALLPNLAGQRFYSQMIDGWVWNVFRGQVVGAGTYAGRPIADTPPDEFVAEMRRWGVRHLFVWTNASREYLRQDGHFNERLRDGPWSHFELVDADSRSVVSASGTARLRNLDFLSGEVQLTDARAGDPVIVRMNYYPAWRAYVRDGRIDVYESGGQLAFRAPENGSYVVRLEYPRYRGLSLMAVCSLILGLALLANWPGVKRLA